MIKRQSGVSLIEILITTLILGIGLLGVAALQVSSVSSNQEGFYTSQATSIAEDYTSRIRSAKLASVIPSVLDAQTSEFVPKNTLPEVLVFYSQAGPFTCDADPAKMCRDNNGAQPEDCTVEEFGNFERWELCKAAEDTLPQGLVRASISGNRLTLVVDWDSASERKDIGSQKNINTNCEALTGSATRNCVIMEIVP